MCFSDIASRSRQRTAQWVFGGTFFRLNRKRIKKHQDKTENNRPSAGHFCFKVVQKLATEKDRLERGIKKAKKDGIKTIHGFFLIGSPGETQDDILESFRFASRLELDTFGFNRLCVYRGTPLWAEYVERGIIDDDRDWDKWFKCSDIDPSVLPGMVVHNARKKGFALLFFKRFLFRPVATLRLIYQFSRYMIFSDVLKLLWSPFRKNKEVYRPDLPARMMDAGLKEPIRDQI